MTGRRDPMLAPLPLLQTEAHGTEVVGGLTGTPGQIDWAELIRPRIHDEFNRVAAAFAQVAAKQPAEERADTLAIIAILEEKRAEVMAIPSAGYYIKNWRELNDQVRKLIENDPRYEPIRSRRAERKAAAANAPTQPDEVQTHE